MLCSMEMQRTRIATITLSAGLAFVFIAFGIDKFINPILWIGWVPLWLQEQSGIGAGAWLPWIGAGEIAVGVLLILPHTRLKKIGACLIIAFLVAVLPMVGWNETGIRDIGLLFSAVALLMML